MYQLKVTVIAKDGKKPLFERVINLKEYCTFVPNTLEDLSSKNIVSPSLYLSDVRFDSIIESLRVLYFNVPHVVTFSFEKL